MGPGGRAVKTIGGRTLSVVADRAAAVDAAIETRRRLADDGDVPLTVGIAVHAGPTLVTTENGRLDYFGGTVHLATRLPDHAGGRTVVTGPVYADADAASRIDADAEPRSIDVGGRNVSVLIF